MKWRKTPNEKGTVCNTATGLCDKMCKLETGILCECWNVILERFHATSKQLQDPKMDLNTAVQLLKSLEAFVQAQRSEFDKFEESGKKLTSATQYMNIAMRTRRRNVRLQPLGEAQTQSVDDEVTEPCGTGGRDQFRRDSFLPIMDMLTSALHKRRCAYSEIAELFGFLSQLRIIEDNEIRQLALTLVHAYNADLEDSLAEELIQFRQLLVSFQSEFDSVSSTCSFEHFMYQLIVMKHLQIIHFS